ncbi:MAG: integrin alpha, partial [Planctomycetota bacterium]
MGDLDRALIAHERAASFPATAATASYNAACAWALKGEATKALTWLERAKEAGFADRVHVATDPDLASLRDDPRLHALFPPMLEGNDLFVEDVDVLHAFVGEAANDQFGWVARKVGDLDGDGAVDFATSAPTKAIGGPAAGRVYVYSSRTGRLLFRRDGTPGQRLGTGIGPAGDVNGDGVPDVAVGGPGGA